MKEIVNRDIVNLDNCESEPIHLPGQIQQNGFLVAVDKDYIIRFCSANVTQVNFEVKDLLDKHINVLLQEVDCSDVEEYISRGKFNSFDLLYCTIDGQSYSLTLHQSGNYFVLEFEKGNPHEKESPSFYSQTQRFVSRLNQTETLEALCQSACEQIAEFSGYDRVMVYCFDEQYNGEVIAESKQEHLESFRGLHYPHTDIPEQARKLYLKNIMRMIPDVHYTPSPILTRIEDANNESLDLGQAVLRSVSPIHIEYLKNMGVGATLTISLTMDGRLWGLIACHHYSARSLGKIVRMACLLQATLLNSQIVIHELVKDFRLKAGIDDNFSKLKQWFSEHGSDQIKGLAQLLLEVPEATGVYILNNGKSEGAGILPPSATLNALLEYLEAEAGNQLATHNLEELTGLTDLNGCAGLLYQKLPVGAAILWFRQEIVREIFWGGEPKKAIIRDERGLHPRKSFEKWQEIFAGPSQRWHNAEVEASRKVAHEYSIYLNAQLKVELDKQQEMVVEKLKMANEELEHMHWLSMHDLKEPLRKMSVFASILEADDEANISPNGKFYLQRIKSSAERLNALVEDMLVYIRVRNSKETFEDVDLKPLLEEVYQSLAEEFAQKQAKLQTGNLPVVRGNPFLLRQMFWNLLSNALKFSKPGEAPLIEVYAEEKGNEDRSHHSIVVADNGRGFENKHSERIFKIFQRLKTQTEVSGSGIGLAICKHIAELHGGNISAMGEPGIGAKFTVRIPVADAG